MCNKPLKSHLMGEVVEMRPVGGTLPLLLLLQSEGLLL